MTQSFSHILSAIRHKKGISQRKAAADLKISQALLSHYENGAREPGLNFVCRACEYYEVTADYLLGRTDNAALPALSGALAPAEALTVALHDCANAEVSAATARYISAMTRRLCSEIYGISSPRELAQLALDMAEAERDIVELFPDGSATEHFDD